MKRTSTEAHVYMRRHQGAKVIHFDVSNVIYHKFLHGAVSYTLSGENVTVMLDLVITNYMDFKSIQWLYFTNYTSQLTKLDVHQCLIVICICFNFQEIRFRGYLVIGSNVTDFKSIQGL